MIIEGEKWACEACVRGHRVSNCQHSDRPLQHINKKGRPVSQCHHCRSMRKSRASHVKCDCGEKTHKCAHLQAPVDGHRDSCCCNHGGRCTCSHKKEPLHLDPVPESESDRETAPTSKSSSPKAAVRRRRANTTNSEGALSFDENGHHKPTYKHSRASQKSGPYQLKRVSSLHSSGTTSNRSADNLVQSESRSSRNSPSSSRGTQEPRRVKSETASPLLSTGSFGQLNSQLPPLDLSGIEYTPYMPNSFDMFSTASENDQGLFSAGLSAPTVDWSHYDLEFSTNRTADNFAPSNYSQPQSIGGGYDFNGSEQAPTLTTTTSGEASEAEDFLAPSLEDFDSAAFGAGTIGSSSYNTNVARSSIHGQADLGGRVDFDTLRFMKASNKFLPTPSSLAGEEPSLLPIGSANSYSFADDDSSLWMNDYSHGLPNMRESPAPFWDAQ